MLLDKGYNIQITFVNAKTDDYQSEMKKAYAEGVDLISGGSSSISLVESDTHIRTGYRDVVEDGFYLDISEYVNSNEELLAACPDLVWEHLKIEGKIYAVQPNLLNMNSVYLIYDKNALLQAGISAEDIADGTLESIEPYFEQLHQMFPDRSVLSVWYDAMQYFQKYSRPYFATSLGLVCDESSKALKVVNFYETPEANELWEKVEYYNAQRYFNDSAAEPIFQWRPFVKPSEDLLEPGYGYIETPLYVPYYEGTEGYTLGISASTNKVKQCYKFLEAVMLDADVSNAIAWGEPGVNYILNENGQAVLIDGDINNRALGSILSNQWITYPSVNDEPDFGQYYRDAFDTCIPSKLRNVTLDLSEIQDSLERLATIYDQFAQSPFSYSLPEIQSALNDAGMAEVIDYINQRLEEE